MLVIFQEEELCDLHAYRGMYVGYNIEAIIARCYYIYQGEVLNYLTLK